MKIAAIDDLVKRSKVMPIGYLDDARESATEWGGVVARFEDSAWAALRAKYSGYAPSTADTYKDIISGCCDRADSF
jgi:hypothetical protein